MWNGIETPAGNAKFQEAKKRTYQTLNWYWLNFDVDVWLDFFLLLLVLCTNSLSTKRCFFLLYSTCEISICVKIPKHPPNLKGKSNFTNFQLRAVASFLQNWVFKLAIRCPNKLCLCAKQRKKTSISERHHKQKEWPLAKVLSSLRFKVIAFAFVECSAIDEWILLYWIWISII